MAVVSRAENLVDLIHGAVAGQRSWRDFLHEASKLGPEGRAALIYRDAASGHGSFALCAGFDQWMREAYDRYYARLNPMHEAVVQRSVGRVHSFDEDISRRSLRQSEYFNDFLWPLGIESGLRATLLRQGDSNYVFALLLPAV